MRILPANYYKQSYLSKPPVFKSEHASQVSGYIAEQEEEPQDKTKKYLTGAAVLAGLVLLGLGIKYAVSGKASKNLKQNLADINENVTELKTNSTEIPKTNIPDKKIRKINNEKMNTVKEIRDVKSDERYFRNEKEKGIQEDIDHCSEKMEDIITEMEPQPKPKSVEELIEFQKFIVNNIYGKRWLQ